MIHDPKYQEEVKNFKKQNETTLARIGSVATRNSNKPSSKPRRHHQPGTQKPSKPNIEIIPEDENATQKNNSHTSGGKSRRNQPPPPPPPPPQPPPPRSDVALVRL